MVAIVQDARNLIRAGTVSSVNAERASVRVTFADVDDLVSGELPFLLHAGSYVLPVVGDNVLCLFLANGISEGFCLGAYYGDEDSLPANQASKKGVWFPDGSHVYFDQSTGALHVKAVNAVRIDGNLQVTGTITHGGLVP